MLCCTVARLLERATLLQWLVARLPARPGLAAAAAAFLRAKAGVVTFGEQGCAPGPLHVDFREPRFFWASSLLTAGAPPPLILSIHPPPPTPLAGVLCAPSGLPPPFAPASLVLPSLLTGIGSHKGSQQSHCFAVDTLYLTLFAPLTPFDRRSSRRYGE